ncbi:hypothetical protein [Mycobacterium sp. URHB0021]
MTAATRLDVDAFVELSEYPTLTVAIQENLGAVADERSRVAVADVDPDGDGPKRVHPKSRAAGREHLDYR